jgi:hypothetical protein
MPTTVDIPGGTATLRDPDKLAVRHRRPMQVLVGVLGPARMREVAHAIQAGGVDGLHSLGLSEHEMETVLRLTDATVFALLESWTVDAPLPRSMDDVGDMDARVYDVLTAVCGRINADFIASQPVGDDGQPVDVFGPDGVEDPDSPTGASVASRGRSTVAVKRAPSDRKKPAGGRSTGTGKRSA